MLFRIAGLLLIAGASSGFSVISSAVRGMKWQPTSLDEAPAARINFCAGWSGTKFVVWGGNASGTGTTVPLANGGVYDPATDSWSATSTTGAPSGRECGSRQSTMGGTKLFVWGGLNGSGVLGNGAFYDTELDKWTTVPVTTNTPSARQLSMIVWTGTEWLVWGGIEKDAFGTDVIVNTGSRYNPTTNQWTKIATSGAPTARGRSAAVWAGNQMIVWGGYGGSNGTTYLADGKRYVDNGSGWSWQTMTSPGLSGRNNPLHAWTGSKMIVWGGFNGSVDLGDGALYDPAQDVWTSMSAPPAGLVSRHPTQAIWTGKRFVVFGTGRIGGGLTEIGASYDPDTNSWQPLNFSGRPRAKLGASVWTGSKALLWGGQNPETGSLELLNSGGLLSFPGF